MPKLQFQATGEALSAPRLATIESLRSLLNMGDVDASVRLIMDEPEPRFIGCAAGSMKWRRNLANLNNGSN